MPQITSADQPDTLDYDIDGRLIRDTSRGITSITYNRLNLPKRVQMGTKDYLTSTYLSNGRKYTERTSHSYPKTVMRISSSGDTTYVTRNVTETDLNTYYGNHAVRNTTRGLRLYNEVGYIDIYGDSVSYHYMVRDYLGSIRAIVGPGGTLEQATDYTVTGIPYTATPNQSGNRRLHTGKELRTFNGLYHYDNHARIYDPLTGRFTTIDPLAGKYPSLTPYNHCANNPLNALDPDGKRVVANSIEEQQMILNTIPRELRSSIRFDECGVLLQSGLMSVLSTSNNFNKLRDIALDLNQTIVVDIAKEFEYVNSNGVKLTKNLGDIEVDLDFLGNDGGKGVGTSTGETGNLGKTLFPDLNGNENSPDNNIQIIINSNLSENGKAETLSHELYGHGYIYLQTKGDRKAASHDFLKGCIDANKNLFKTINNAINETIKNME